MTTAPPRRRTRTCCPRTGSSPAPRVRALCAAQCRPLWALCAAQCRPLCAARCRPLWVLCAVQCRPLCAARCRPLWVLCAVTHDKGAHPQSTPSALAHTHTKVTAHQKWVSHYKRQSKWVMSSCVHTNSSACHCDCKWVSTPFVCGMW